MLEALLPGWQNPELIAVIVGLRIGLNCVLTGVVASRTGIDSRRTALAAGLTIGAGTILILALRPGILGQTASSLEMALQLLVVLIAGDTVYRTDTSSSPTGPFLAILLAISLLAVQIPIYGEAFVAP
ncbi:hypothetical protein [Natronolimnobius baerhuensis]|uniref:Uncharacterized protein n=1 Tax=Natronolimnobius baerhuensis TaxID=253108 RepID=A0A202EBV3_9EURY|nr:hypothetical protein [Natronolimnobius baerhuensis]OVE85668.1 hypothetical protein B2G88_02265 [Natronolimnobius baerhuensis]